MRANSQKPEEFYAFVESYAPAPRYAELFQRFERPNWDGHGDEALDRLPTEFRDAARATVQRGLTE